MIEKILDCMAKPKKRIILICGIVLLIFLVDFIVYIAGGTTYVFTHLMYIPIIISAFLFDIKGAVGAAALGGITLGPWMPVNVSQGIMQKPSSWIIRGIIFIVIGLVVGYLLQRIKIDKEIQIKKSFTNTTTGFPNANKLKLDLVNRTKEQKCCSLITFRIVNLDDINMYVDYSIGEKALLTAIETLANLVGRVNVYSVLTNEFAVTIWGCSVEDAYLKAKEFLNYFNEPVFINEIPVNIDIRCGIINYPIHAMDGNDLFKKMSRTLDQYKVDKRRITIYEDSLVQKNKLKYETIVHLYDAIKNGRFTIVYQPIINVKCNEVKSVEALIRWNNSLNLSTCEFIQIAEDAGLICEITKWVITNVVDQIRKWQDEGLRVKVSVNVSSDDLRNCSIIEYTINYMKEMQIDPALLEFELTERVIVDNKKEVKDLLEYIKEIGIEVSLDDFGMGYNSLVQLSDLPIDNLKIDKFFVDHINEMYYRCMIEGIIQLAHNIGKKVIVEGVETEEQLELLNDMNCDNIQGYYFCKPLPSEQLKAYIMSFDSQCSKK